MPESQRSLRMTDIYCRFNDDISLSSEKDLQSTDTILPDSMGNDTSSNETESVVSEDEYIKQFVLGKVYSFI